MKNKFHDHDVFYTFQTYPANIREKLIFLRELIFKTAKEIDSIGEIEETLKWGEPAYITSKSKSGSTIRLGWKASQPEQYMMYFNCKTTLIDTFKEIHGSVFNYSGNRALIFNKDDELPMEAICDCIAHALTYHLSKKQKTI